MTDEDSNITQLFCSIMDIVKLRRKIAFKEREMERDRKRYNVDRRILALLDNEYERSLEEDGYKMKTVLEIKEMIRKADELDHVANKRLELEWAMEQSGGH
jgi:predicted Holliday junction resolvase-like endonuclease